MFSNDAQVIRQLNVINRKLDLIMTHLGLSLSSSFEAAREQSSSFESAGGQPSHAAVVQHLMNGKKIAAVKAYRDATGAGLKEAKEAVEKMARDLGLGWPGLG